MSNKVCIIDTETGGLDPSKHSILSLGAVILEDRRIVDEFEILIKEPNITIALEAIHVNKMNILKICSEGTNAYDAVQSFRYFTLKYFPKDKVVLGGHNVNFDVGFLKRLWSLGVISEPFYDEIFSHRIIDTCSILRFLTLSGRISLKNASLTDACKYFGITVYEEERHTAIGDARLTAQLLIKMMELLK